MKFKSDWAFCIIHIRIAATDDYKEKGLWEHEGLEQFLCPSQRSNINEAFNIRNGVFQGTRVEEGPALLGA